MHQFDDTAVAVRTHGSQIRLLADTLGLEQPKCPSCHETLSKIALFRRPSSLLWIRRSITVRISSGIGDHVDVRVRAPVLLGRCADFENPGRATRFIDQVMAIGITTPERRAVPRAQCFFTGVSNQRQLTIEHPDEFVLNAVPVALAGPGPRFYDSDVHTELSEPRIPCQPLAGLPPARLVEGSWIGPARLRGHDRKVDLLHRIEHLKNELCE